MIEPGTIVGKYRLGRLVGEGGMGSVFAATHLGIGTQVALKMLKREVVAVPSIAERFMREARAAGQLKSEHVCKVLDIGRTDDGLPFMVMELLEGCDLATAVRRDRPSISAAVSYIMQACVGLAEAHRRGMVHRDIKPANLFLTTRNGAPCIKILDFGIATAPRDESHPNLTSAEMVMGSPNYMSPEQISSAKNVDPRSDVWSLGVSLYELSSGRLPFREPTFTALSIAIATEPHLPLAEVPAELARIVERCLAKRREDRYADATELLAALTGFCTAPSKRVTAPEDRIASPPSEKPGRSRRLQVGVAILVALSAVVGIVLYARSSRTSTDRAREAFGRWSSHWNAARDCLFGSKRSDDIDLQLELHLLLDGKPKSPEACDPWLTNQGSGGAESTLSALGSDDFASVDVYDAILHLRKTIAELRCEGDDCAVSALRTVNDADLRVRKAFGMPADPGSPFTPIEVADARKVQTPNRDADLAGWKLVHGSPGGGQSRLTKETQQDWYLDTGPHGDHAPVNGIPDARDPIVWAHNDSVVRYFRSVGERSWPKTNVFGVLLAEAQEKRLDIVAYADPRAAKGALVWTVLVPESRPPAQRLPFDGEVAWQCLVGDTLWVRGDKQLLRFVRGAAKPDAFEVVSAVEDGPTTCSPTRIVVSEANKPRSVECTLERRACEPVALPGGTTLYAGDELVTIEPSRTNRLARVHRRGHASTIVRVPGGDQLTDVFAANGRVRAKTKRGEVVEVP